MIDGRIYATVNSYDKDGDFHRCTTDDGREVRIDLMVDGSDPSINDVQWLVGRRVSWERETPYIVIAHKVEIEEGSNP